MDAGLVILGVIVLFGAAALFKSTGMLQGFQAPGTREKPDYLQRESQPSQLSLPFETPATVGRGEFRVCRNCFSENPINAEYCSNCGKRLIRPKDLDISKEQRKWFRQFNWTHNPFTPDINPSLFTGYKEQVDEVLKKINLRSGNILVIGDLGTGKTTLLRWLELNLPDSFHPIYVFRPPDKFSELVDVVAYSLDPSHGVKPGEYNLYNIDKLVQRVNKNVVILLDEAHELDFTLNKSLKTLGDVENVTLVLAGVPRLEEKLKKESPALYDRIVSKVELLNLTGDEVEDLIVKRIENVGGWGHEPFTDDAIDEIYRITNGNPREVIKMCDAAVTDAITEGILTIDKRLIFPLEKDAPHVRTLKPDTSPANERRPEKKEAKPLDLKGVVEERITKLTRLYEEYVKSGDSDGMKEVVSIAESTVTESKKRLESGSVSQQERERLSLMIGSFEKWLAKIGKNKAP